MPDFFYLLSRWKKQIILVVLISLIIATVVLFFSPKKYLSVSTALPASSYASDKARIFNENIQELYSALGTMDELDMIAGTGKLDTLYLAVTDEFSLVDHYKTEGTPEEARLKAAFILKKDTRVTKSEFGELKVKVWNKSKNMAPQLANALMNKIQGMHQELQSKSNLATLASLEKARAALQSDSISQDIRLELNTKYERLIAEYKLMVSSKPQVLLVVEKARPAIRPDKPKTITILVLTAVLSFLFALLLALTLERRKTS